MVVAWGMIKDPLVKQRSQAPPVTVVVTMASQTLTWAGHEGQRGSQGDISSSEVPLCQSCLVYQPCQ